MQFKQGDEAICAQTDGLVKIRYGPYTSTALGMGSYLVEWLEGVDQGKCSVVGVEDLEPAPRFKVGQRVMLGLGDEPRKVVAGPFNDIDGSDWWVLESKTGHAPVNEKQMCYIV
ncbi:hypothetical protein ABZ154_09205 [Streptomyces sp. NPDC006261]|uniref:hypothetical protein n=1 Tax=Streptomyces sp. NPDC006261 TaxID=3156739 RepID=UPI0033B087AE